MSMRVRHPSSARSAPKLTRDQLEQNLRRTDHDLSLYERAYFDARERHKPDAVQSFKEEKGPGRYTISLYNAVGPQGGYVDVNFIHPGQRDTHRLYWLDEWTRGLHESRMSGGFGIAAERLSMARRKAYELEAAAGQSGVTYAPRTLKHGEDY